MRIKYLNDIQVPLYYIDDSSLIHELVGKRPSGSSSWSWSTGALDDKKYKAESGSGISASCDSAATLSVIFIDSGENVFKRAYIGDGTSWQVETIG